MDIANFVLTFGPAGLVAWSVGTRLIKHVRARRVAELEEAPGASAYRDRPPLPIHLMLRSTGGRLPIYAIATEQRSYAAEQPTEQPGTGGRNAVPGLREHLGTLPDDVLLRELALVVSEDGTFKYAESRIAKFIGGRVEDRIAQVRAVRGTPPPPKKAPIDPRFPFRTPEQAALRAQLGMKQKGALN
jgi:hypothetical protein